MSRPGTFNLEAYKGSTFGPVVLTAYTDETRDTVVDLTGYTTHAKVRESETGPVIFNLAPVVTDGPAGIITFPEISDEVTRGSLFPRGNYIWDLLLEDASGKKTGPYLSGDFIIHAAIARS